MFQNHHLQNCKFFHTRPRQEVSGCLYQLTTSKLGTKKKKKRFVKLNGHRLTISDPETGELRQDVFLSEGGVTDGENENEFVLTVKTKSLVLRASSKADYGKWLTALQYVFVKLEQFYDLRERIGHGAFSVVMRGRVRSDGKPVAVKVVENRSDHEFLTEREILILSQVEHENIVRTYDVFEARKQTFFVMEYMSGGQLYDVIAEAETFSEKISREVLKDILLGVRYLHSKNIVHRDIKPENLLCENPSIPPPVKIADFGLSNYLGVDRGDNLLKSFCGSLNYLAPEMIKGDGYGKSVDLWAVGVIFHQMLTSLFPFDYSSPHEYLAKVSAGPKFDGPEW
eukprot:CAMPEP_0198729334 /NCGR_PEP_ID=MMETSP1475-20131203/17125_1 /TAXON_ID= ORGANISM="Unidentified sp., Strain CCMP1999" /NCGR_SAMPLE_ID=MMETSP1475 /ASSEMBLY_ACC=CAM_ASM_001111 /LENGTH=339 /DNA_ID=CAMNT_0044491945 /DNA_START=289 /DNA_END=1305 /DNA_ORIENTATION=+